MSAKANLLKYLDLKGIKKADFYRKTGLSNGFLDKNANISSDNLEIIINIFDDINLNWLVTGAGNMLKLDQNHDNYQFAEEDSSSIVAESGYSESTHSNTQLIRLQGQIDLLRDQLREKDAIIQDLRIKLERGK